MRTARWTCERANRWFERHGWQMGCVFIPSTAVNQLEMWQAETFDIETIDRELGLAESLGMNAVRVYLHDLVWHADPHGLKERIGRYLSVAESHGIRTALVFFDDCWFPDPVTGPQADPVPGVHNSRWVQSPGIRAARDPAEQPRLKAYVQDVCNAFGADERVLFWDVYNEVGNSFLPVMSLSWARKVSSVVARMIRFQLMPLPTVGLLRNAFAWIREVGPDQPLTAGLWMNHLHLNRLLVSLSDIVSFHNYGAATNLAGQIAQLKRHGRPVVCTEYMARTNGSTFEACLPVFRDNTVSCFNWGLVSGRTQTIYAWRDRGDAAEPEVWFHDIFRPDGTPYRKAETDFISSLRPR